MFKINKSHGYIILIVLCFIAYFNTFNNSFVFDDDTIIVNNANILKISNIPDLLVAKGEYKYSFGALYRPLIMISFAIDNSLWGLKPSGFHFTNLLLHIIAVILLYKILLTLFTGFEHKILASLISAAIFAVHPVHTESVSFISSRTDVLCSIFFFLSFYYYIKYRNIFIPGNISKTKETPNKNIKNEKVKNVNFNKFLILSFLYYFLGLLSKEMIITLPLLFILYDFVLLKQPLINLRKYLKVYFAFILITSVYLLIRYFEVRGTEEKLIFNWFYGKSTLILFSTMIKTIPEYVRLLFIPINLIYDYNGVISYSYSIFDVAVIFSIIFTIALIWLSVFFYKNNSIYSYSILFFLITLTPVINIVSTCNIMAERFLYMISFSLSVAVGYFLCKFIRHKNFRSVVSISLIIIIIFSYLTYERNKAWKDNDTLYMSAEGSESLSAMINVAGIYTRKGQIEKAEKLYRKALDINDNAINAHQNLGILYMVKKNYDSAEIRFRKAQQIDIKFPNSYYMLAKLKLLTNKTAEAITELETMQKLNLVYKDSGRILDSLKRIQIPGK
ncbi:MAG TPA: tetratricopeptide repeat protein [Ignavibacteria bacterium]